MIPSQAYSKASFLLLDTFAYSQSIHSCKTSAVNATEIGSAASFADIDISINATSSIAWYCENTPQCAQLVVE